MEVTLEEMLAARESRAFRQFRLIQEYGLPIVSFCLNIPGPVKDTPLIRRAFYEGCQTLEHRIGNACRHRSIVEANTGCEALYAVDMEPLRLKEVTTAIEDSCALGRLFDMDVLDNNFNKLDRELVSGKSRDCIVCGAPGKNCASRRVHSIEQLQSSVNAILLNHFRELDAQTVGNMAVQSLLDEVCTTPKPGLVDRLDSGSHRDMDIFTFMASAAALGPYFQKCARIGMERASDSPAATFAALREAGLDAELQMYRATSGINTHKGAIFTLGILCGAAGRLWNPVEKWEKEHLLHMAGEIADAAIRTDFAKANDDTAGMRLYASAGILGIRGEVAAGLPSVSRFGLPAYYNARNEGMNRNDAGVIALLHLIARVQDTNMIARGGEALAEEASDMVRELLSRPFDLQKVSQLNDWFIERNLSPGGCADLLAVVYFLETLMDWER